MLNVVVLMGRLVADPELRHTQNDTAVCSFRIAVERNFVSKGSGERQTDFIDIVAWRGTAEFVSRYFAKGSMIAIEGSIQTRQYEDKQGNRRTAVEVLANNVSFTGSKRETGGYDRPPMPTDYDQGGYSQRPSYGQGNGGSYDRGGSSYDRGPSYGQGGGFESSPAFPDPAPGFASGGEDDFKEVTDDDLPF